MLRRSTALALAVLLVFSAAVPAAPPQQVDVLIGFNAPPGQADLAFIRGKGGRIAHEYKIVPAVAATIPANALAALAGNKNILLVEPDITVQAIGTEYENAWGVGHIGAEAAHTAAITGAGVRVAVIDTGIDYTHSELAGSYVGGYDFVNDDSDPFDDNSHGTHCAGTIAAAADGSGVVGVAPGVELYAFKVLSASGSGSFSDVIAALDASVANGIQVTNNSYGSSQNPGTIVEQAFINANAMGVLNIAAAGNSGNIMGKGNNVNYPGAYDSVTAVAATDSSNNRAYFSSTGPTVEVAAPGLAVYSTVPGGYATYSGTSMACPHVVGTAALFIQAGGLSNTGARELLSLSAIDLGATGDDNLYGAGLVDIPGGLQMISDGFSSSTPPPASGPPSARHVHVATIDYFVTGGKTGDRDLVIVVTVLDDSDDSPVANANVTVEGFLDDISFGTASGTTGSDGTVQYRVRRAPSGVYTTNVLSVSGSNISWDGVTPSENSFEK